MSLNATLDFAELQGEMKKTVKMAIKMLKANEPIEKIIEFTELSISKIEELQKDLGLI